MKKKIGKIEDDEECIQSLRDLFMLLQNNEIEENREDQKNMKYSLTHPPSNL
jgi:hypothetical protein